MKEIIEKFEEQIRQDTINDAITSSTTSFYELIVKKLSTTYSVYYNNIPFTLKILELYSTKSLAYSVSYFFQKYQHCISLPIEKEFVYKVGNYDEQTLNSLKEILDANLEKKSNIRLSEMTLKLDKYSDDKIEQIINMLVNAIQKMVTTNVVWEIAHIHDSFFNISILRQLCLRIHNLEIFYSILNIFFDKLNYSQHYQISRDICEEILISSYNDNCPEMGFFISFRVYSNQGNTQAALLYGNIFLSLIEEQNKICSNRLQFEIIWQSIKLFLNIKLYEFAVEIYDTIPKTIKLNHIDDHSITSTYFTCKIFNKDVNTCNKLVDYLNKERENIINEGPESCRPWLVSIYNLKRLDFIFDFHNSGLEFYISLFESIVSAEQTQIEKSIIFGSSELKNLFNESLFKLTNTRNIQDFVHDNQQAIIIGSRMIAHSYNSGKFDFDAILSAMIVKSDFSLSFKNKGIIGISELKTSDFSVSELQKRFGNPIESLKKLNLQNDEAILWIISSEEDLFQLIYLNNNFSFIKLSSWNRHQFNQWCNTVIPKISYETTKKDSSGFIQQLVEEDYEVTSSNFKNSIVFPKINDLSTLKNILLIKDISVSNLPHNIILNNENEFISSNCPITNVMSLEWLTEKVVHSQREVAGSYNSSSSIYIPIEGGDYAINLLYSKLEEVIREFSIKETTSITSPLVLNSTINIITAHGNRDIANTHFIFPSDDKIIHNLDGIIGDGKVLILFVCHSGSMTESFFTNEIIGLAKRYLSKGYEAVIAPFWSLNIDIPPIWLSSFLSDLNNNICISECVFNANKKVFGSLPTPEAWTCLHLYGNPFFKIDKP